ncbi:MAG: tetratricopeptide repeat protein, partial [Kofleriaceae bacterium]|nr:tetratricopeptide repeat protein [Kofleriaceae bacterium]
MVRSIHRPRAGWLAAGFLASAAASLVAVGSARAEDLLAIERNLSAAEMQAGDLTSNMPAPAQASATTKTEAQPKRLVQAQLAFRSGSYGDAALVLFDIVAKGKSPEYDPALYYLGESLFQKGDKVAARTYFAQLVSEVGASSKYYQAALKRLIELAIELGDAEGIEQQVLALDNSAAGSYVRGKWQYAQGQHDDALRSFADVSKESSYGLQAQYFIGAVNVAKKDLAKASEAFLDAVNRKPKTNVDRRIIELSQLALGRVFYEREQPSKSVDWYLAIDRRSDLFSDALFEAAWVYVKSKQVDKALSALELLSAQDPLAQKTPTVRILEGNLRVRKAQLLRQALLTGLEANGDPADEYIKAEALFRDTKGQYGPSHAELRRVLDEKIDPALYLAQVTGRDSETFAVSAQMPEIAASWVRDEGNVGQLVTVEGDLGDIQANIADGERTIARLEAMLAIPHGANAYPLLAERRARANELMEQVIKIRTEIADAQAKLVQESSEIRAATSARMALAAQIAGLPNAELAYRDRLAKAQSEFDALDATILEVEGAIGESEASTSALRTYGKQRKAAAVVAAPGDAA